MRLIKGERYDCNGKLHYRYFYTIKNDMNGYHQYIESKRYWVIREKTGYELLGQDKIYNI